MIVTIISITLLILVAARTLIGKKTVTVMKYQITKAPTEAEWFKEFCEETQTYGINSYGRLVIKQEQAKR